MNVKEALQELRKEEKRNFEQSFDLIINLKSIDVKKENIGGIISIPYKIKEKKVCGFLTKKSELVKSIGQLDFAKYKEKKPLKNLIKEYDFFIAAAPLMPSVASTFGKVLGPTGKMPSPQLGILMKEEEEDIKKMLEKIELSLKIRVREPSVKVCIGREGMKDNEIEENIKAVYNGVVQILPTKKDNVKNVLLKMSMSKPRRIEVI